MIKRLLSFAMMLGISISLSAQATWTQQNTNFTDFSYGVGIDQVIAVSPTVVWADGFNGNPGGVGIKVFTRTNDAGITWTAGHYTQFSATEWPKVLAASSYLNASVVVLDSNGFGTSFWGTLDGGTTWTKSTTMFIASASFADGVYFWDATHGFCYGDPIGTYPNKKFEIYTTSDGGTTWTAVASPPLAVPQASTTNEYGYDGPDCAYAVSGGIGFIITDHGRVLKTTDYGITWAATTIAPFTSAVYGSVKICASSANNIITGAYTTATTSWAWAYTTDGGTTWSTYAPTGPFYTYGWCYVPGSTNMLVATSPFVADTVGVAYSTDGGQSWTNYIDATYLQPTGSSNIQCLGVGFADQQNGWVGNYDYNGLTNSILYMNDPTAGVTLNSVNGNDVNVYPNPSNGLVHFSVNGPNKSDISIKVFDMVGNIVFTEEMNVNVLNSTQFDFTNFAKGMYMVQIISGNDIKTQKLVIR